MHQRKGFTIIELIVVFSIIALLIAILLPALGKAQQATRTIRSQANVRELVVAHAAYSNDWLDNQWTLTPHNLMSYSNQGIAKAAFQYNKAIGRQAIPMHQNLPVIKLGHAYKVGWGMREWVCCPGGKNGIYVSPSLPEDAAHRGTMHYMHSATFNRYLNGRWFDRVLWAPKDTTPLTQAGECLDMPGPFCIQSLIFAQTGSYILSPAAMFTPELFEKEVFDLADMIAMPGLFRSPTYSQARYPDLKTHILEKHWLQNMKSDCNAAIPPPSQDAEQCQPYLFNADPESRPVAAFYDGHVSMIGVGEAMDANSRAMSILGEHGSLWHHNSAWRGGPTNHWFHHWMYKAHGAASGAAGDNVDAMPTSSFHILTRGGILGRDIIP